MNKAGGKSGRTVPVSGDNSPLRFREPLSSLLAIQPGRLHHIQKGFSRLDEVNVVFPEGVVGVKDEILAGWNLNSHDASQDSRPILLLAVGTEKALLEYVDAGGQMNESRLNLGVVNGLVAESFGEPGNRTFRIRASTESGEMSVWLEKEQLVALGGAIEQILGRLTQDQGVSPRPVLTPAELTGEVVAHAASLSLGFDTTQNAFALEASDLWDATLEVGSVVLLASRKQLVAVETQIDEIVLAGRPRCSMCGRPLDSDPHFCPPSNGHAAILGQGRA
jgi:uncharacterized repeat protein (TIGR03847 family)